MAPGVGAAAVGLHRSEIAADQNLAVTLHRQRQRAVIQVRVKLRIGGAVGIEPGQAVAEGGGRVAVRLETRETTRDEDLPVRMLGQGEHDVVRVGIVAGVQRPVGVEPGQAVARGAAHAREVAARHDAAVGLQQQGVDLRGQPAADVGIESRVDRAVRVETGEAVARDRSGAVGLQGREIAADKDLAVRLQDQRPHRAVGTGIKRRVERAVRVDAGEVVARGADRAVGTHGGELTGQDEFAVGLGRHGVDVAIDVGIVAIGRGGD
jgi:hypothetical protein